MLDYPYVVYKYRVDYKFSSGRVFVHRIDHVYSIEDEVRRCVLGGLAPDEYEVSDEEGRKIITRAAKYNSPRSTPSFAEMTVECGMRRAFSSRKKKAH